MTRTIIEGQDHRILSAYGVNQAEWYVAAINAENNTNVKRLTKNIQQLKYGTAVRAAKEPPQRSPPGNCHRGFPISGCEVLESVFFTDGSAPYRQTANNETELRVRCEFDWREFNTKGASGLNRS